MSMNDLLALKKEVEALKQEKKMKMALATSKSEKAKLQAEIKQLDNMGKSESGLKSFGRTFSRGLGIVGKTFWRGIKSGSKNLNANAPEYRDFGRSMMSEPNQSLTQRLYAPRPKTQRLKKAMKKMKAEFRSPSKVNRMESWELP